MKKYDRGELAKTILKAFLISGLIVSCIVLPGMAPVLKLVGATGAKERGRVKRSLRSLEKNGLIVRKIKNGEEQLLVTTKGEQKLARYLLEDLQIQKLKKWDKRWRVVMFDIPETKARVRTEASWKIKDMGMKAVQDSVFISPYPCKKEIDLLANHFFIKKYFIYFETDNIECHEDILKEFKLC